MLPWKSGITHSECVSVAFVIRHTNPMRRFIFPSLAYPAVPYFSTLSNKRHNFRENVIGHKRCVLILPTTFVRNISHCKNNSARYHHKCTGLHVKCPLILSKNNCSRSFSILIRFAGFCYGRFMITRYKFNLVMYVQRPLVVDRKSGTERNLNEITAGSR